MRERSSKWPAQRSARHAVKVQPVELRLLLGVLVVAHLATATWHGSAHAHLGVALSTGQRLFIDVVIVAAPLIALVLLWTRHAGIGLRLLLAAMTGSLLFGVLYHYMLASGDNVQRLPPSSPALALQFTTSAGLLALLELASAVAAAMALHRFRSRKAELRH